MIYRAIGKAAVKYGFLFLRRRYGRQIRVGAGLVAAVVGAALYFGSRNVPEG